MGRPPSQFAPWGRSFDEYRRMFALTADDLEKRILGCGDGPASFNAELTNVGGTVTSCDPLYECSAAEIKQQIRATSPRMVRYARDHQAEFVWSASIPDPDALARHRLASMGRFLADFEAGRHAGRYIVAQLPDLPFASSFYDLALCSHFLFLYSEQLSTQFHVEALCEMLRVAAEVRVFPLLELGAAPSRHVEDVAHSMTERGYEVDIAQVDYEFQQGGNRMMRLLRANDP